MIPLLLNSTGSVALALFRVHQQDRFSRIPLWVWILVACLIVIIVGIIITLREEEEAAEKQVDVDTLPAPPKPTEPAAVTETVEERAKPVEVEPEAAPVTEAEIEPPPPAPVAKPRRDNLKRIKGIGPKIEGLLKENGITTFAQLAETEVSRLQALLDEAGWEGIADPTTWPELARQFAQKQ